MTPSTENIIITGSGGIGEMTPSLEIIIIIGSVRYW